MSTNLSEIAFEQITGNYYWGKYGDFKVIVDISTGYINATHLCEMAFNKSGNTKDFSIWKMNVRANALINEVAASLGIPRDGLLFVPTDLPNEIRGTYAHPKLIPHIASWASPKFAIMVSDIVNAHSAREYKKYIRVKGQIVKLHQEINQITPQQNKIDRCSSCVLLVTLILIGPIVLILYLLSLFFQKQYV